MLPEALFDSPLLRNVLQGAGLIAGLFAIVFALEALAGRDVRRYRSRAFATDAAYALIYLGGIYGALVSAPVLAAISLLIPQSWNLRLLDSLPPLAGFLVYWLLADFIGYWVHRWEHHNPWLWRVHSVHHAQTCITFATSWRNHILEQLFVNVLMFVPLMVLGMPRWSWLPVILVQYLFEALQHSDLDWRYGRLHRVLVSPVFHSIHHSPERARHDSNYGKILSVWDHLFGTFTVGERPARYGVAGLSMPVSFWGTLLAPFKPAAERDTTTSAEVVVTRS
jgi:sterol desaturase/sphingolipid hydroxylase (fatty acid hydroxylase superfamily)